MAYMTYRTPHWHRMRELHGRTAMRPISARLLSQSDRAYRISTGIRTAWVPKRIVSHDAEKSIFTMPGWLAEKKLLD